MWELLSKQFRQRIWAKLQAHYKVEPVSWKRHLSTSTNGQNSGLQMRNSVQNLPRSNGHEATPNKTTPKMNVIILLLSVTVNTQLAS